MIFGIECYRMLSLQSNDSNVIITRGVGKNHDFYPQNPLPKVPIPEGFLRKSAPPPLVEVGFGSGFFYRVVFDP